MLLEVLLAGLALAVQAPPSPSEVPVPPLPASGTFKIPLAKGKAGKLLRVGVPEPNVVGNASPREVAVLSQALVTEIRKLDGISAIGIAEIREMLAQEYRRQMLGCTVDQECLTQIAGALGVDDLVSSELVVDGGTTTFTVNRIDMRTTKVLSSANKRLARRNAGEEVLGTIGEMVATIYGDRPLRAGELRGVAPQVARWLNPPPLPRWAFFATMGAAVAAAGAGTLYAVASNATTTKYNALATGGGTVAGRELTRLKDQADSQRQAATIGFALGGAFAVAGIVEAFFTDWHDDRAAVRVGPNGAAVVVKF